MLVNDDLKFGDLVQVKYEENEPWKYAYFDKFWHDGRIQVIPNGQTPITWTNCNGKQIHQLEEDDAEESFNHSTYNFYRKVQEVTDSGDIGNSTEYISHWGQKRIN